MSWDSMDDPSTASWMQSLRDGRASPIQSPVADEASTTSGGSGRTSPACSMNAERPTSSGRTSAESSRTPIALLTNRSTWMMPQMTLWAEWAPFSGIWPRWGSMSNGEVFARPTWAPATVGSARSSSPSEWQTPRTMGGGNKLDAATVARKGMDADGIKRTVDLSSQAEFWPPPNTRDAEETARHTTTTGVMHSGTTLTDAIRQWPTPASRDSRDPNARSRLERNDNLKGEQLPNFIEHHWRTPNTRDWHEQGPRADHPQRQLYIADQVAQWPTPDLSNRKSAKALTASTNNGRRSGGGNSSPPGLEQVAELACGVMPEEMIGIELPPATKQILASSFPCSPPAPTILDGLPFFRRVRILLLLCRRLQSSLPTVYARGGRFIDGKWRRSPLFRKRLSPEFCEWLMAWPVGWSNVDLDCNALEMAWFRSSARRCLLSLLTGWESRSN